MKHKLGGKIVEDFAALRPKTYSYLTGENDENKKAKITKKCVIKRQLKKDKLKVINTV